MLQGIFNRLKFHLVVIESRPLFVLAIEIIHNDAGVA